MVPKSIFCEYMDKEGHEERQEDESIPWQLFGASLQDGFMLDVILDVKYAEDACKHEDSYAQDKIPRVEQGIKTMACIRPSTQDWLKVICEISLVYHEITAIEEGCYGSTQQQRTYDAIDNQTYLEGLRTQEVAYLVLELIAHGLYNEGEQDNHPQPIGSSETRAIEERK